MKTLKLLLALLIVSSLSFSSRAEMLDQGLSSIMDIIDKAIAELNQQAGAEVTEVDADALENASTTVINLSRTLGTLSYSRLQCGEASVLAEFTQRVQLMPEANRDPMRDAFQEGFDKSKEESPLLAADECDRLTRSRARSQEPEEAIVAEEKSQPRAAEPEEVVEETSPDDPKLRHLRIAELSGQLAYKRKYCQDEKVFNRDYNEYLESIPEDFREEVKTAYWKGYQHGKRLNKGLTREQC